MGTHATPARASYTLWRAVRTWKDVNYVRNCWSSAKWMPLDHGDVPCSAHVPRYVSRFRTFSTGSIIVGEENLLSMSRIRSELAENGRSLVASAMMTHICGTQFLRTISSHCSTKLGHEEAIEAKSTGSDKEEDDDDVFPEEHGGESSWELSREKIAERNSQREVLWERVTKSNSQFSQTLTQIQKYIDEGNSFTKEDAVFIISRLRRFRRYKQAMQISDWVAGSKIFPWTENDQKLRLNLKGKLGLSSEVELIFNSSPPELQTEGTYNTVIQHFCERCITKKAHEWVERLTKSGCLTQAFAFNRLLVLYKDRRMGDKILEVLAAMSAAGISKDMFTYLILMSFKSRQNDVLGVEKIFDEWKADTNVELDISVYAALATTYISAGLTEKATNALENTESLGLKQNVSEVIATLWGKLGNKEKVLKLWDTMKEKEVVAARTYSVMMDTFGKLGMVDHSEMLFNEMRKNKGVVRPRQFTSLLAVYVQNNMIDKVETLISGLDDLGLKKNAVVTHNIVGGYLKLGRLDKALSAVSEAQWKGGFRMWLRTMLMLLDAVAEKGDVITAEKIFDNMTTAYNQKNLICYNTLLKAYAKARLPADGFLERMAAANIPPNEQTHQLFQLCSVNDTIPRIHTVEAIPETAAPPLPL